MKDVKTKAEVSKRIKKLERKEEVKTFLFNLSVNATERVKCKEERTDDCWEAYEDGYAAACFVRIEILSSEIVLNRKGGPDGA